MRFVYPSANERHWQIDQEPSSLFEPCVRDYPVEHSAAVARNLGLVNDHGVADMPAHNASYDDPDCVYTTTLHRNTCTGSTDGPSYGRLSQSREMVE